MRNVFLRSAAQNAYSVVLCQPATVNKSSQCLPRLRGILIGPDIVEHVACKSLNYCSVPLTCEMLQNNGVRMVECNGHMVCMAPTR